MEFINKMKSFKSLIGAFVASIAGVNALLTPVNETVKTLVLLDNWATVETHSHFFDHIRETLGHEL